MCTAWNVRDTHGLFSPPAPNGDLLVSELKSLFREHELLFGDWLGMGWGGGWDRATGAPAVNGLGEQGACLKQMTRRDQKDQNS